jgi:hypothetical protein
MPESFASLIAIGIFIFLAILVFVKFYKPTLRRVIIVSLSNIWLAIWSVIFGNAFMFMAMQ